MSRESGGLLVAFGIGLVLCTAVAMVAAVVIEGVRWLW